MRKKYMFICKQIALIAIFLLLSIPGNLVAFQIQIEDLTTSISEGLSSSYEKDVQVTKDGETYHFSALVPGSVDEFELYSSFDEAFNAFYLDISSSFYHENASEQFDAFEVSIILKKNSDILTSELFKEYISTIIIDGHVLVNLKQLPEEEGILAAFELAFPKFSWGEEPLKYYVERFILTDKKDFYNLSYYGTDEAAAAVHFNGFKTY
jgi:hypothetical protein